MSIISVQRALLLLLAFLLGGGLIALIPAYKPLRSFLSNPANSGWAATLAAWTAALVSVVGLLCSNQIALHTLSDSHDQSDAAIKQLKLESAPILTEDCSTTEVNDWTFERTVGPNHILDSGPLGTYIPPFGPPGGNHVLCTIRNYSRLPAVHLKFFYRFDYCTTALSKIAAIDIPTIAPGSNARILLANASNHYSLGVQPLPETSFIMPPNDKPVNYIYPEFQLPLIEYQLNASPSAHFYSDGPVPKSAIGQMPPYCKTQFAKLWQGIRERQRAAALALAVGDEVEIDRDPTFAIGFLVKHQVCDFHSVLTGSPGSPRVYAQPGKRFTIVGFAPDRRATLIRGISGGIVCVETPILRQVRGP